MEPSSHTLGDIVDNGIIYSWIEELLILSFLLHMEMIIVAFTEEPLAVRAFLFQNLGSPGNLT